MWFCKRQFGVFLREMSLVALLYVGAAMPARAQQTDLHQLQALVAGLQSPQQARQLSLLVNEQDGVVVSRFDVHTQNLMVQMHPSCTLDDAALNALLEPHGVRVRCVTRSVVGSAPFRHLEPGPCREADQTR